MSDEPQDPNQGKPGLAPGPRPSVPSKPTSDEPGALDLDFGDLFDEAEDDPASTLVGNIPSPGGLPSVPGTVSAESPGSTSPGVAPPADAATAIAHPEPERSEFHTAPYDLNAPAESARRPAPAAPPPKLPATRGGQGYRPAPPRPLVSESDPPGEFTDEVVVPEAAASDAAAPETAAPETAAPEFFPLASFDDDDVETEEDADRTRAVDLNQLFPGGVVPTAAKSETVETVAPPPPSGAGDEPEIDVDDDEPELAFDVDDDEPELAFDEDDEPELDFSDDDLGDDEDGFDFPEDEGTIASEPHFFEPPPEPSPPTDQGAATARRTVGRRRREATELPLVGAGPDVTSRRAKLLRALAGTLEQGDALDEDRRAAARARIAASELLAAVGDPNGARTEQELALAADPQHVIALRAARRRALVESDLDRFEELVRHETNLDLPAPEKIRAILLAGEVARRTTSEPDESVVRRVDEILASEGTGEALALRVAASTHGGLQDQAAAMRAIGERGAAELLSARAGVPSVADDEAPAPAIALGRAILDDRAGLAEPAARTYREVSTRVGSALSASLRRRAMRLAPAAASVEASDPPALLAEIARAAPAAREDALRALADQSNGAERAQLLGRIALLRLDAGDIEGALVQLESMQRVGADPMLHAFYADILARRSGDERFVAPELRGGGHAEEATWSAVDELRHGRDDSAALATMAERDGVLFPFLLDLGATDAHFAAALESAPSVLRDPLAIAWLRLSIREGHSVALAALEQAQTDADEEARRLRARTGDRSAWVAEAQTQVESRAANGALQELFAARDAGLGIEKLEPERLQRALDLVPGQPMLSAAVEPLLRVRGEHAALAPIFEELALVTPEPAEEASIRIEAGCLPEGDESSLGQAADALASAEGVERSAVLALVLAFAERDAARRRELLDGLPKSPWLSMLAVEAALDAGDAAGARQMVDAPELQEGSEDFLARVSFLRDVAELRTGDSESLLSRRTEAATRRRADASPAAQSAQLRELAFLERALIGASANASALLDEAIAIAPSDVGARYAKALADSAERNWSGMEEQARELLDQLPERVDRAAWARYLATGNDDAEDRETILRSAADALDTDLWLARRLEALGRQTGDLRLVGATHRHLAERLGEEGLPYRVRAASAIARDEGVEAAVAQLEADAEPRSPAEALVASEARAYQAERGGLDMAAGAAYEAAAESARSETSRALLLYRAGLAFERAFADDVSGAQANAIRCLQAVTKIDLTYEDAADRLAQLLRRADDAKAQAALLAARAEASEGSVRADLHREEAKLLRRAGALAESRAALKSALEAAPTDSSTLEDLVNVALEDGAYAEAAEALIRFARLRQERDRLQWVFFELGRIYDEHLPDARRAEAAFARVLKLAPGDPDTLERLASLRERAGDATGAANALREWRANARDAEERDELMMREARLWRSVGNTREAELLLEPLRRTTPERMDVLRELRDLYRETGQVDPLHIHTRRSHAVLQERFLGAPFDANRARSLFEAISWGEDRATTAVTSAVFHAMGVRVAEGEPSPAELAMGNRVLAEHLRELLVEAPLGEAAFVLFERGADAFERQLALPAPRPDRVGRRDPRLEALQDAAQRLGVAVPTLQVQKTSELVCVPVGDAIVVSEALLQALDHDIIYPYTRALVAKQFWLGPAMRVAPAALDRAIVALARSYDGVSTLPGIAERELDDVGKKVRRALPRKIRDHLGHVSAEVSGGVATGPGALSDAIATFLDRAALLALGDFSLGLRAATVLAKSPDASNARMQRLLSWATSPQIGEVYRRGGVLR